MQIRLKRLIQFGIALPILLTLLPSYAQAVSNAGPARDDLSARSSRASNQEVPNQTAHNGIYVIGDNDVLGINVWNEKDISGSVPVRSDGKISLPLIGEIQAAGRTPLQLEQDITKRLQAYITAPTVAVIVEEINSKKFNILGEVTRPGSYSLALATTVVDAIALAGGFRDFAKKNDIYVLRQNADGSHSRIKFNYKSFIKGKKTVRNIDLEPHDTIIVP